ncbi:TrpBA operon transcriptional activator [Grimontia indica]|uniref:TrpBA operon transcriptional activator n=1 Tax=Grimontia indica TaxID=1056512 RepID=R1GV58_9GAMM|nr:LysR substrate-binding domain-containing protein [Grimontia indica]EOD80063.1 TrpBA operon transcriptional activator [Grimontia indica]
MKRRDIPSLDDLRAFEAVGRLGSVRAAADDLALTHGAVSRRVSKLSEDIRVSLLEPVGRGVKLTSEGEKLFGLMQGFFEDLADTLEEIRTPIPSPPVLLSCERSVAMHWLIPHLSQFQDARPDIEINLSVGGGHFDFKRDGITLALRRMDFSVDPRWKVEPLFEEEMGPVMTEKQRELFEQGDYVALSSKTRPDAWRDWLALCPDAKPPREYRFLDHHFLMVESAVNGLGVAICPKVLAINELKKQRLVSPLGFAKDGSYYGLLYESNKPLSSEAAEVKRWLKSLGKSLSDG